MIFIRLLPHVFILWIIYIFMILSTVSCLGIFSVNLQNITSKQNYRDENGTCCAGSKSQTGLCSQLCNLRVRICVHLLKTPSESSKTPCVFWEKITPILGESSLQPPNQEFKKQLNVRVEDFYLILEVYHATSAIETGSRNSLGVLMASHVVHEQSYKANSSWKTISMNKPHLTMIFNYRFQCAKDFYGAACRKICKARDDSHGHYTCNEDGQRVCYPGYSGTNCENPICTGGCQNGGSCISPEKCRCLTGYRGKNCNQCEPLPGCVHGTCGEKAFECKCKNGYGGVFCNIDLNWCTRNSNPCTNGGTCLNRQSYKNFNYSCSCPKGYEGTHCERFVRECSLHKCYNGGTCKTDSGDCVCPKGFYGPLCQFNQTTCADQPCGNRGRCLSKNGGFVCECNLGWKGRNCEVNIDDCELNPCKNGGRCVDQVSGYICVCPVGYKGTQCQVNIDDCKKLSCINGGQCQDGANSFQCSCPPGFSGRSCQNNINDCLDKPCRNGGVCQDGNNDFECICPRGFSGKWCELNSTDPCSGQPCLNGGICSVRELNTNLPPYKCTCAPGYSGITCQRPIVTTPAATGSAGGQSTKKNGMTVVEVLLVAVLGIVIPLLFVLVAVFVYTWRRHKHAMTQQRDQVNSAQENESNALRSIHNKLGDTDISDLCSSPPGGSTEELTVTHNNNHHLKEKNFAGDTVVAPMGTVSAKVTNQMRNLLSAQTDSKLEEHEAHYLAKGLSTRVALGTQKPSVGGYIPASHSYPASLCTSPQLTVITDSSSSSSGDWNLRHKVSRRPPPPPLPQRAPTTSISTRPLSTVLTSPYSIVGHTNLLASVSPYEDAYVTEV